MPRVTNYELRSRVFQLDDKEGIYKYYRLWRRVDYCRLYNLPLPSNYHPEVDDDIIDSFQVFNPYEWAECERIYRSDKSRSYRLKIKVRYMLTISKCSFVTFTFTDNILNSTSEKTRRDYVRRWLASLDCAYIANIDYGEDSGREHYHALVATRPNKIQLQNWIFNYGALYVEPVRPSLGSSVRLSKYVSKLTNHAVKVTTRRCCLLFSRKHPLPSTFKEFYDKVTPILDKGYVLRIESHTKQGNFKTFRPSTRTHSSLVRRCCVCGSIIPVLPTDMYKHISTVTKNGKSKKYYYCSDCIKEYKIKIDKE